MQDTKLATRTLAFLQANNKLSERETMKIIIFKNTTKRIKFLEINLIKEVKSLLRYR